jgi:hypothetical protein
MLSSQLNILPVPYVGFSFLVLVEFCIKTHNESYNQYYCRIRARATNMTSINTVYSMLLCLGPDDYSGCTQLEQTLILVLNSIQYTCTDFSSIDDSKDL